MNLRETDVAGAFVIEPQFMEDNRGFFVRVFDESAWKEQGLNPVISQCNASLTHKKGTIRGFHYQIAPHEQAKAIRCTKGAVFDVVIDVRKDSPTYGKWAGVELTEANHLLLYIPEGCAHGFQTLEDNSEVFYPISNAFNKEFELGIRYDDPTFNVQWPLPLADISEKDLALPFLQ